MALDEADHLWFLKLIGEREEGERSIACCCTFLCAHWWVLTCALTRDHIRHLGLVGWCSNH